MSGYLSKKKGNCNDDGDILCYRPLTSPPERRKKILGNPFRDGSYPTMNSAHSAKKKNRTQADPSYVPPEINSRRIGSSSSSSFKRKVYTPRKSKNNESYNENLDPNTEMNSPLTRSPSSVLKARRPKVDSAKSQRKSNGGINACRTPSSIKYNTTINNTSDDPIRMMRSASDCISEVSNKNTLSNPMEENYKAHMTKYLASNLESISYSKSIDPFDLEHGKESPITNSLASMHNLAIPMSYFCVGVALHLLRTPLIVYFIEDRDASPAEVNILFTVMAVPWCFKVIYGFLSDCIPIKGLRRKPYFLIGWVIFIASNLILAITQNPSTSLCIFLVFTQSAGYMLADVMTDALIVERSRYEPEETRGMMQSKAYFVRFMGSTLGSIIGSIVYNKDDWEWYLPINVVFFINMIFPLLLVLPILPFLREVEMNCPVKSLWDQCINLFETVQLRAVWQPMAFVYLYNVMQLTNAAWMNFLVEGLDFSAWMIGLVGTSGTLMTWMGITVYKNFFFGSNWREIYFWCTTLASLIAIAQVILVFGINKSVFHVSDIVFSVGDDVLLEFVIAMQFLPMCIMYLGLCPEGSEGTTYAMLTTWSNLAGTVAFDISTVLTRIWDVSSSTIESGDYSGVWKLSLLCGILGPLPLVFIRLIPSGKEEQKKLQQDTTKNFWAGVIFIGVMVLSFAITFIETVYEIHNANVETNYDDTQYKRRLFAGRR
mmetsp:Transcript_19579/g.23989  ORF Transcript_19579/g.23989 Transcript_19579/m.23989 type:complete len:714 (-) Transcript_19579:150-2291(-)